MNLLLRNPDAHSALDGQLYTLLQSLHAPVSYTSLAAEARKIVESATGQKPGLFQLIRPTWETDWRTCNCVMTAWFDGRVCGNKIADAIHRVFTELVRFVLDATEDNSEQEYADQLSGVLSAYLRLRGYSLKSPEESLSEAEQNILDALKKMKAEGQLPARYHAIAPVAGYNADHCRRILAGLVRRKLIVNGRGGYDLK